eukprot:6194115-Pleurochrysis_carterae.AAC.3
MERKHSVSHFAKDLVPKISRERDRSASERQLEKIHIETGSYASASLSAQPIQIAGLKRWHGFKAVASEARQEVKKVTVCKGEEAGLAEEESKNEVESSAPVRPEASVRSAAAR